MKTLFFLLITLSAFFVIDSRTWTFSNLLMAGSQATVGHADAVALGAQKGLEECREQFTWDRWNCPQSVFTQIYSKKRLPANKETAFVHAIISAGIVHTVTKNCSTGQLENCKCDNRKIDRGSNGSASPKQDFRWGGCSDNVDFGVNLAKSFLDEREMGHDPRAVINLHNNHVGRMAVRNTMVKVCKCHGISGSCTTKTCWMRVADFSVVGSYLKAAYRDAFKVDSNADRDGNSLGRIRKGITDSQASSSMATTTITSSDHQHQPSNAIPSPAKSGGGGGGGGGGGLLASDSTDRLAFEEDSPDYCTFNTSSGSNGTLGRHCSRRKGEEVRSDEKRSCRKLCRQCGFRVKRQRKRVVAACNCRFKWCCQVQCDSCVSAEVTHTCEKTL